MKAIIRLMAAWAISSLFFGLPALAQSPPAKLQGTTLDGKPFVLNQLKGKVVLLMFWSTDCAVCRDKMPELRINHAGWRGKPFEMVLVSTDRRLADVEAYEKILARTVPVRERFVQMWSGDASFDSSFGKPVQLPATFLIGKDGKVVEQWTGRVPADAWDKIAELLL